VGQRAGTKGEDFARLHSAMNLKTKQWLRWLPAIAWMTMIFLFSNQPGGGSGALSKLIMGYLAKVGIDFQAWFGEHAVWVLRKCAHFTEYMILFFLLFYALRGGIVWKTARWWALLGVFLYASSDEIHQLFIPGRVGDALDVMIDTCGGMMGVLLATLWMVLRDKQRGENEKLTMRN
jgi:VanZ family protein